MVKLTFTASLRLCGSSLETKKPYPADRAFTSARPIYSAAGTMVTTRRFFKPLMEN